MVRSAFLFGCLLAVTTYSRVSGLCSTCLEEQCYDNGECKLGCVPRYVGEYCDEVCPSGCLNNLCHVDRVLGTVTCTDGCEAGYCGVKCALVCPEGCVTCDRQCTSCRALCPERHYGKTCNETCRLAYGKCDRETGECIRCRTGYYGDECTEQCVTCFHRTETIADRCLAGCEICKSEETCQVGFYGETCQDRCSDGCNNTTLGCNRATGECSAGCMPGYSGLTCIEVSEVDKRDGFVIPVVISTTIFLGLVVSLVTLFILCRRKRRSRLDIQICELHCCRWFKRVHDLTHGRANHVDEYWELTEQIMPDDMQGEEKRRVLTTWSKYKRTKVLIGNTTRARFNCLCRRLLH